jgi:hypothetical protein
MIPQDEDLLLLRLSQRAEGSYAAAYRLVGGGWKRYFPDRPEVSNMGPLAPYDAFLILVTAPVSCTMAATP